MLGSLTRYTRSFLLEYSAGKRLGGLAVARYGSDVLEMPAIV